MNGYQDFFNKRRKLDPKRPAARVKKRSLPPALPLAALALFGGGLWGLVQGGFSFEKFLSRVEISIFGQAQAQDGAKSSPSTTKDGEKKSTPKGSDSTEIKVPKRAWSDEEISLFTKLEERKKQLDAREANLDKMEAELQKQKEELEKRLAALEEVRGNIASKLDSKVKADNEKVTALVSVYANMKPAQAAKIIEGLNEDLAVEVLTKMKNKSAAEILNMMDPEKAKHLSERFAGFREASSL